MEQHHIDYTHILTLTLTHTLSGASNIIYWWYSMGDSKTPSPLCVPEVGFDAASSVNFFSGIFCVRSIAHTWLPNLYFSFIFLLTFGVLMETDVKIFHLILNMRVSVWHLISSHSKPSLVEKTKMSIFKSFSTCLCVNTHSCMQTLARKY